MAESSQKVLRLVLVLAGICSGGISASVMYAGTLSLWLPGILFSFVVLLPWARAWGLPRWKCAALVALAIIGYEAAVFIVYPSRFALFPLSGFVGTSLAVLMFLFDGRRALQRAALLAIFAGTLLACVFFAVYALAFGGIMIGLATWQLGIAVLLAMLLPSGSPPLRTVVRVVRGSGPGPGSGMGPGLGEAWPGRGGSEKDARDGTTTGLP